MMVSIITCTRNQRSDYLTECAESILRQGYDDLEWIVVDDESTSASKAETLAILQRLPARLRWAFVPLPSHAGLAGARNTGIARARGRWVVVLDSDDRLMTGLVRHLVQLPPTAMILCCASRYFSDSTHEDRRVDSFERLFGRFAETSLDPFLWFDFYYHGLIARRTLVQAIGMYREDLRVGEDQDILLRAVEGTRPHQVQFNRAIGYEYRRNNLGVCSTQWADVEKNYCRTMLQVACRRAPFVACRFAGSVPVDGVDVDHYEYATEDGRWHTWDDWRREVGIGDDGEPV